MEADLRTIARIKQVMDWFPGVTLGIDRRLGKTEAIMQLIHEKHGGRAVYMAHNQQMFDLFRSRYSEAYPGDPWPLMTNDPDMLQGKKPMPIYVDEPWMFKPEMLGRIKRCGWPIAAMVGTNF